MPHNLLLHPEPASLQAFALGKVDAAEVDAIQAHLRECPSCCEFLDGVGDDTFVGLLHDAETVDDQFAPQRAVAMTEQTVPNPVEAATLPPSLTSDTDAEADSRTALTDRPGGRVSVPALADHPRFRVLELIGQGGMGAVYRAEHRHMKRHVALKVINPKLVSGRDAAERFRREVEAAARLHHPNIVTAYDAELAGDAHFLVMEYVQGTDLQQVVQQRGPLPVAEACDYIRQAALGLQHAHENGMVHRDIKPHNLMLTTLTRRVSEGGAGGDSTDPNDPSLTHRAIPGTIKILDFGLASLAAEAVAEEIGDVEPTEGGTEHLRSSLTQAGSIMGTPDYMAPEQARDAHTADIRADIYSLGCTLYALLTGMAPFPGGTTIDKIVAHAEHAPPPISRGDVPRGLRDVLARMLAKDPAERFQTPADVAAALAPFADADVRRGPATPAITAPADGLTVAASIAFLTAIGSLLYSRLAPGALMVPHPWDSALQFCSLANLLYATLLLAAGQLLRKRRARTAVLVTVTVVGVVLPAAYAVNYIMERLGFWPLMIPQWLGVPLSIWAVVALFRRDVRDELTDTSARSRFGRRELAGILGVPAAAMLLGGVIWVATDTGQIKIDSKVDDVQVVVSKDGKQVEVVDLTTGTSVKRLPSGDYQIAVKGNRNDVTLSRGSVTISRWKKAIVMLTAVPAAPSFAVDRTEFARVVAAGRGKLTPQMKQKLLADNHPVVWQLSDPFTRRVIESFANLPDSAHRRLLKDGYLKWKYASLDADRQKVYQDYIRRSLDAAKKQGMTLPGSASLEALKTADVGIAVVTIPELKQAVVSWYLLLPDHPKPAWLTVAGLRDSGDNPSYYNAHNKQLSALRLKPYSPNVKPLIASRDENLLQGTWRPVRYEQDGQPVPAEIQKRMQLPVRFIFQGNSWVAVRPDLKKFESTFTLDSSKQPKWMDVTGSLIEGMPNLHGIYKLDGDTLTLCAAEKNKPRPADFVTKGKPGYILIVARRVPAAQGLNVHQQLQGKWVPVSGHFRAKPFTSEQLARMSIVFDGHRVAVVGPDGKRQIGTFDVDATRQPMFIDVTAPDGKEKSPGIFEFDGDRLKLAFIDGDYARPTDFAPSNRPDHMTLTLKRVPVTGSLFSPDELKVLKEAESFLAVFDAGRWGQLHGMLAGYAKRNVSRDQFSQTMQTVRDAFGPVKRRNIQRVKLLSSFPGLPKGRYAVVRYKSDFERKQGTWESLLLNVDPDGLWRVNTYANTVKPLPIPGEKKKPVQSEPPSVRKKRS